MSWGIAPSFVSYPDPKACLFQLANRTISRVKDPKGNAVSHSPSTLVFFGDGDEADLCIFSECYATKES